MLPFILFLSFYTGVLVTGNDLDLVHFTTEISLKSLSKDFFQYLIGSLVLAIVTGFTTFGITLALLKLFRKRNHS
jgi:uncharacterized protein (DUF2062 family)